MASRAGLFCDNRVGPPQRANEWLHIRKPILGQSVPNKSIIADPLTELFRVDHGLHGTFPLWGSHWAKTRTLCLSNNVGHVKDFLNTPSRSTLHPLK